MLNVRGRADTVPAMTLTPHPLPHQSCRRRALITCGLLLLAGIIGCSRPHRAPADLAETLEPIRARYQLPALAAGLVEGDRLAAVGAVGRRSSDSPEPVTIHDQFHLGSCTKSMTATILAMLVEERKITWKTTIGETFPELRGQIRPEYLPVTLEMLLHHRSGLPEDRQVDDFFFKIRRELKGPVIAQRRTLTEWSLARPPAAPPGEKMQYSNTGYAVAAAVAERVTGQSWEALMHDRLFKTLEMSSAGFGPPGRRGRIDQPRGHERAGSVTRPVEPVPEADNPECFGPAGRVHASMADWGRYVSFHLQGMRGHLPSMKARSFAAMYVPAPGENATAGPFKRVEPEEVLRAIRERDGRGIPDGYAYGWSVSHRSDGQLVLSHAGSNGLWFALVWMCPEENMAVLAATNVGDAQAAEACEQVVARLIERHEAGAVRSGG